MPKAEKSRSSDAGRTLAFTDVGRHPASRALYARHSALHKLFPTPIEPPSKGRDGEREGVDSAKFIFGPRGIRALQTTGPARRIRTEIR